MMLRKGQSRRHLSERDHAKIEKAFRGVSPASQVLTTFDEETPRWGKFYASWHKLEPKISGAPLQVLCCLIPFADGDTGECWPSWSRIAADTGLSRSTIAAAIEELRTRGIIAKIVSGGGRNVNRYKIVAPTRPAERTGPKERTGGVHEIGPHPSTTVDRTRPVERTLTDVSNSSIESDKKTDVLQTQKNDAEITTNGLRQVRAALAKARVPGFVNALGAGENAIEEGDEEEDVALESEALS